MGGDCCERQKMRVISSNDNIAPLRREQVCMGGGVVTGLILQGSLSLYSCYMSNKRFQDIYNLILEKICSSKILTLHLGHEEHNTDQKTTFLRRNAISFQECLLFCFTGWKKKKRSIFYIQWFRFLQCNLHYIVVGIAIYVYNIIYIYIFIYT